MVESTSLLKMRTRKGTVGSNPTLTATHFPARLSGLSWPNAEPDSIRAEVRLRECFHPAMSFSRFFCGLILLPVVFGLSSCFSNLDDDALPVPDNEKEEKGLLPKMGGWLGKDKKKEREEAEAAEKAKSSLPTPQKLPIGSVHLVHESGGFVLIRTSRNSVIPPEADLLTYDSGGRPTGKLRLSPERKGDFLTADIVEGRPNANDRVVMFSYLDEKGQMQFGGPDPDQGEVLE